MFKKAIVLVALLFVGLLVVSSVSAADNLTDDVGCNDNDVNLSCSFDDSIVKSTDVVLENENIDELKNSFDNDILMANGRVSTKFVVPERFQDSFKILITTDSGNNIHSSFTYKFDSEAREYSARGGDTISIPSNLKTNSFHSIHLYYEGTATYYEHCYQTLKFYYNKGGYSEFTCYWPKDTHFSVSSTAYGGINVELVSNYDKLDKMKFEYYLDNDTNKHYSYNGVIPLNLEPNTYHNITLVYSGNSEYKSCSKTVKFLYKSSIQILESNKYFVDGGMNIPYRILSFDGKVSETTHSFAPFGTHNVMFSNSFNGEKIVKEFTIPKCVLQTEDLIVDYNDLIEFKARAANANNIFTSGLRVTFAVDGKEYGVDTDNDGFATIKIHLKAGNYSITTKCYGVANKNTININPVYMDDYYENVHLNSVTTYNGENKFINYGWNGYFKGSLMTYDNSKLVKTFDLDTSGYVDDYASYKKYSNNFSASTFAVGYYTLKIVDKNGNILKESYLNIEKIPTKIQVNTIKTTTNTRYTLNIAIKDVGDKNVKNGYVNVKINGKTYKVKVIGGIASLKFNVPSKIKTYSCSVSFLENSIYKASSAKFNVIVKKYRSQTTVNSVTIPQGSKYTLKVNVKYSNGNKIKSGTVKVTINGKTYSSKISNGVAKVTIAAPSKVGKYDCKATYSGNNLIHGSSDSFTLTSQQKHVDITVNTKFNTPTKKTSGKYTVVTYKKMNYFYDAAGVYVAVYKDNKEILPFNGTLQVWIHANNCWQDLHIKDYVAEANGMYSVKEISSVDKIKVRIWV